MADIFQINLPDGNTYNIKDTTKTASTGTTQSKWYKIAEGTFPDNGERLSLLFAVSSGTDNVYSGIYNFTARTVDNVRYINLLVYLRDQMVYTYDAQAVYDNDTWAIYQYIRTGYTKSITWTIISENIDTSANPPYTLYNNATPEASIPSSYTYQTPPGIGGQVGGVYQQNNVDNVDKPILLGNDNYYVFKNSNIAVNPYTGNLKTTQINGATIGNPPRWEGTQAQYDALTTYDPNTIYYITDGIPGGITVINDLSDVSILSPQDGQMLTYNSTSQMWTNASISTACSVNAGPTMPSNFPVPTVTRRGNLVQVVFGIQLPARTYANTDVLWYINPVPISIARVQIALGGSFPSVNFSADGSVKFNGAQTLNSATWFIGQAVYLTDGEYHVSFQPPGEFISIDPTY